eukprot:15430802-Alexandrium_andersonii.AAC.1
MQRTTMCMLHFQPRSGKRSGHTWKEVMECTWRPAFNALHGSVMLDEGVRDGVPPPRIRGAPD